MHQQQQPPTENATPEANSQSPSTTNKPVQTVRAGAIGGSIWRSETDHIGITLSRSWKADDGRSGHSKTFYAGNRKQLHEVVDQACDIAEALERTLGKRVDQLKDNLKQEASND